MTRTRTRARAWGTSRAPGSRTGAGAALFLRVHADGHPDSAVRGTHTLVPALRRGWTDDVYRSSRRAASFIQPELVRALGFPDRGIGERSDFTGFNWADVPVILVELGFMTNPGEDRALARSRSVTGRRSASATARCASSVLERRAAGLDRAKVLSGRV